MSVSADKIILLTGTVYPNALATAHIDIRQRIKEYSIALQYYARFGRVVILENSGLEYDLPEELAQMPNVEWVRFPKSSHYSEGKGYQEFAMLDAYIATLSPEVVVYKVTGRYCVCNFAYFLKNCDGSIPRFDLWSQREIVTTSLFICKAGFYQKVLANAYRNMDDAKGAWAERVLYSLFRSRKDFLLLPQEPDVQAVSGSTGLKIKVHAIWKKQLLALLRGMLNLFGIRCIPW